jgi:hypothetical protein
MSEQIIEVTTSIKVTGVADQRLLDHLGQMAEGAFREMYGLGEETPNDPVSMEKYEETELELVGVDTKLLCSDITSIDEWFSSVSDCKAFMVNGNVCNDFSFPSPDDEMDDIYSFYVYGPNGYLAEIFLSACEVTRFKLVNNRELICDNSDGSTYTFCALA